MSDTLTVKDGYQYDGEEVVITQRITEADFREVETILDRDPERFKAWAEMFCFTPPNTPATARLCAYLREQRIAHRVERREAFTPAPATQGGGE